MHRILLAPVDLFYNGGIGTYIKASTETHAQVKDRANDNIRVNGNELRCKVVAEGGNLGATQAGRIEFALAGGRIFTDAIDNSAGVDCSDHEVNVKIWLDTEVNAGQLDEAERNRLLNEMTGRHREAGPARQHAADATCWCARRRRNRRRRRRRLRRADRQPGSGRRRVARAGAAADRDAELQRRKADGLGLTTPELAVVVANVKNRFKRLLAALPLTDQPWAETDAASVLPGAAGRHARSAGAPAGQCDPRDRAGQRIGQPLRSADAARPGAGTPHRRRRSRQGLGPGLGRAAPGAGVRGARP